MNALKNVLFFGLLIAVLFGVYISLNKQPDQSPLPPGMDVSTPPVKVDVPSFDAPSTPNGPPNVSANGPGGFPPPITSGASVANNTPDAQGGMAQPYPSQAANGPGTTSTGQGATGQNATAPSGDPFTNRTMNPPMNPPPATDFNPPPAASGSGMAALPAPPASDPPLPGPPGTTASGNVAMANTASTTAPAWPGPDGTPPKQPDASTFGNDRLKIIEEQVRLKVNDGKFADALEILSGIYDNPDLAPDKAAAIISILDQLAAKVIYSREPLLGPLYVVAPGDTLSSIADHYGIPPLLLARINGIDPKNVPPGKRLKVFKGPFSAFVSIEHGEMTMRLDGRYAGRFPLALSGDLQHASGFFSVKRKSGPPSEGKPMDQWIELSDSSGHAIGIQATPDIRSADRNARSTMWLSDRDMDDVYGILSVSSRVVIQR